MDIAEEKQAQRTSGKAARRALSPEQRAAANAALCARLWQLDAVQNAQTILLYAAFGGEAGLAGFAAEAARRGKVLAYPVCGENCSLTAAVPGPDGWETGLYGIRTPVLERSVLLEPEPGGHGQRLLRPLPAPLHKSGKDRHCIGSSARCTRCRG